ncbi:MAG: PilZ domain-containing protein [Hyphomicrobiales bacterium]|nr:MAG: PilZ domain-containing protein [Hyphomicrobiales bacterium]
MKKPTGNTPFAATLDIRFVGAVQGRYVLPDSGSPTVHSCRTASLSPSSVVIAAAVVGKVGERVVLRLEALGTLNATITQIVPGGFRADLVLDDAGRVHIASQINWLKRRSLRQAGNKREGQRLQPRDPKSHLYVDGQEYECFVIDVSPSGIAVSASLAPPVGTIVDVGGLRGRVVRHMEGGIGIAFDETHEATSLFEALTLRPPANDRAG